MMGALRSALVGLGVAPLGGKIRRAVRAAAIRVAVFGFAAVLLVTGLGFLLAAGFLALAAWLGAIQAAAIIGGALTVAGLGLVLAVRGPRAAAPPQSAADGSVAGAAGATSPLLIALLLVGMLAGARKRDPDQSA